MIRKMGIKVPALKIKEIRSFVNELTAFLPQQDKQFPILHFIELILPQIIDNFSLVVGSDEDMKNNHGLTAPDKNIIQIKEEVYKGAYMGNGRDRFTLAHELGHFFLHRGIDVSFARNPNNHKIYEDSEWQADAFAAELLMPIHIVKKCKNPNELAEICQVSFQAAEVRFKKIKKEL